MTWVWDLWRSNAPLTLALILLLAGLGVPTPASLAIIATGALVRHGGAGLATTALAALGGTMVGTMTSYEIARRGLGRWLEKKKRKPAWSKAVGRFERDAWTTTFLSRWLLTPLALPVSYLAGSARYPRTKYAAACALGTSIWIALYGGVGYVFADQWETAAAQAKRYEFWIGGAVVLLAIAAFFVVRARKASALEAEGREATGSL